MKKLKKLELKDTPKMQDLQSEEMKHFQGGMGTWNEEFGSYMLDEVTVYGDAPIKYEDTNNHVFGCSKCPTFDSGPGAAGDPAIEAGYRWGVAINHWISH